VTTTKSVWIVVSFAVVTAVTPACITTVFNVGSDYIILSYVSQREIQQAGDHGYRVAPLPRSPWMGGVLLQKATGDPDPVEYLVLTAQRTATILREMNEAGTRGYRYAGGGLARAVMQRNKGITTGAYEYETLASHLLQTMENEVRVEAAKGFHVVEASLTGHTIVGSDEFFALLERSGAINRSGVSDYRILSTARASTFEQELQKAAEDGYRLNPRLGLRAGATLVEKAAGALEPLEYRVLSTSHTNTLQAEMDSASGEGYRFAAVFTGLLTGALRGSQLGVVMQREKGSTTRTHEHVLLATSKFKTMQRELPAEFAKGFRLVDHALFDPPGLQGVTRLEYVAILERPVH
jgi:hypothetical protein